MFLVERINPFTGINVVFNLKENKDSGGVDLDLSVKGSGDV